MGHIMLQTALRARPSQPKPSQAHGWRIRLQDIDQISPVSNITHTQMVHAGLLGKSWLFSPRVAACAL